MDPSISSSLLVCLPKNVLTNVLVLLDSVHDKLNFGAVCRQWYLLMQQRRVWARFTRWSVMPTSGSGKGSGSGSVRIYANDVPIVTVAVDDGLRTSGVLGWLFRVCQPKRVYISFPFEMQLYLKHLTNAICAAEGKLMSLQRLELNIWLRKSCETLFQRFFQNLPCSITHLKLTLKSNYPNSFPASIPLDWLRRCQRLQFLKCDVREAEQIAGGLMEALTALPNLQAVSFEGDIELINCKANSPNPISHLCCGGIREGLLRDYSQQLTEKARANIDAICCVDANFELVLPPDRIAEFFPNCRRIDTFGQISTTVLYHLFTSCYELHRTTAKANLLNVNMFVNKRSTPTKQKTNSKEVSNIQRDRYNYCALRR